MRGCAPITMDFRVKQPQATIFDDLRLFCSAALLVTLHLVRFASHFEKETQKLADRLYQIRLRYDKDDETELLIRVLSFGPVLEVIEPSAFVTLMRKRIAVQKQRFCQ